MLVRDSTFYAVFDRGAIIVQFNLHSLLPSVFAKVSDKVSGTNLHKVFSDMGGEHAVKNGEVFPALDCSPAIYDGLVLRCLEFEKKDRPIFYDAANVRTLMETLIDAVPQSLTTEQ